MNKIKTGIIAGAMLLMAVSPAFASGHNKTTTNVHMNVHQVSITKVNLHIESSAVAGGNSTNGNNKGGNTTVSDGGAQSNVTVVVTGGSNSL